MEISIHSLLDGATRAIGTVAVIDVFRAFTTAAVALANGASRIVMVRSVEEALALREAGIGQIWCSEASCHSSGCKSRQHKESSPCCSDTQRQGG
jgi:2-phosphosulfolactate phosphatase